MVEAEEAAEVVEEVGEEEEVVEEVEEVKEVEEESPQEEEQMLTPNYWEENPNISKGIDETLIDSLPISSPTST